MFRYLGEKILMSDTDTDVYHCEFWFIFCTVYVCVFLVPIDITAIKRCGVTCLVCRTFHHHNNDYIITFLHWRPAACQGLPAMRYWWGHWAMRLIECTPRSDYYILAHWRYWFADVRCANRPNSSYMLGGMLMCHLSAVKWRECPLLAVAS